MNRSFQAKKSGRVEGWHSRGREVGCAGSWKHEKLVLLLPVQFFLPENKNMAGDVHAPGSVRPEGQAVFLGHKHFHAKRLLELPQLEAKIVFVLSAPKFPGWKNSRGEHWALGEQIEVFWAIQLPLLQRTQIVCAWLHSASQLELLGPFAFSDQCHSGGGGRILHQNFKGHTAAFINKIMLWKKESAEANVCLVA